MRISTVDKEARMHLILSAHDPQNLTYYLSLTINGPLEYSNDLSWHTSKALAAYAFVFCESIFIVQFLCASGHTWHSQKALWGLFPAKQIL